MPNNIQKQQKKIVTALAHYSGPFPPAAELEHYESICPGFTEKLMERYVAQSNHRMELETKVVESGIRNSARGQVFAFILALTTILIGSVLLYLNKDIAGIVAILGALGALVGVFIYGNKSKKDERIQKARSNPDL